MVSTTPLLGNILPGTDTLNADLLGGAAGGMQGGLLGSPWQYIADMGAGMLSNAGPSFAPHSFATAMGAGFKNASERQDAQFQNEYRRAAIKQQMLETQGQAAMQQWIAEHPGETPDLATIMRFMPGDSAKAMVASITDPSNLLRAEQLRATIPGAEAEAESKKGDLGAAKSEISNLIESTTKARDAADYLATVPGGGFLATISDERLKTLRAAKEAGYDKGMLGDLYASFSKMPREYWDSALDAAEQMQKARFAITTLSNNANRAGAFGLEQKNAAQAEGAGIKLQTDVFDMARRKALAQAGSYSKFDYPELDATKFAWRTGAPKPKVADAAGGYLPGSTGDTSQVTVTPQPGVPQRTAPPPLAAPLPPVVPQGNVPVEPASAPGIAPVPPAGQGLRGALQSAGDYLSSFFTTPPAVPYNPAAPNSGQTQPPPPLAAPLPGQAPTTAGAATPRKVQTTPIDPKTGMAMYRSKEQIKADVQSGNLVIPPGGIDVIFNGQPVHLNPTR